METKLAENNDRIKWDQFVNTSSNSSLFHLFDWKRIFENNYGLETFYLMAKDDGVIKGILPLVLFKSRLTGRFFVSFPVSNDGGICTENEEVYNLLLQESIEIAKREKADYIEFHHKERYRGLATKTSKFSLWLKLKTDLQELWKGFEDKVRNQIRKAEKCGLEVKIGGMEDIDRFYQVYAINMRDLGIPIHSKKFFMDILKVFPGKVKIFSVLKDNRTQASGFTFSFKDRLEVPWASSIRKYNKFCPNHLLYWKMLKFACSNGLKYFNFGRSNKDSGVFRFKEQWGAQPRELYWQYYLLNGNKLPETNPQNPKYALARKVWQKTPILITKIIGPRLMRILPY
jgi:FemAB-related protein (PEP-CTERM system-associated)